MGLMSW